jgi:NADP-dependent 3-hydroxy acid dehydrogenase YdfG
MKREGQKTVLITGCSSGIGAASALALQQAGWNVWASARNPDMLGSLAAAGCKIVALDVCARSSIDAALSQLREEGGRLDALVNNAGYSQSGALETLPMAAIEQQFKTNLFGLLDLTQQVLPMMRAQGGGRIINIGSMGGSLTFPGGGVYHATKYALEAVSDALRFEVAGFGIKVVLIQPGLIRTDFSKRLAASFEEVKDIEPYRAFNRAVKDSSQSAYIEGPLAKLGGLPTDVGAVIVKALSVREPKARYRVTASAYLLMTLRRLLGDRGWDKFLRGNFPRPGTAAHL